MNNVINLPKKERFIWICDCGCSTFYLYEDNTIECALCKGISIGEWRNELPEEPKNTDKVANDGGTVNVVQLGNSKVAAKSVLNKIDLDTVVVILTIHENGYISGWTKVETDEEISWLKRQLTKARKLLLSRAK